MAKTKKREPTEAEIDRLSDEMYEEYLSEFLKLQRPDVPTIHKWTGHIYKQLGIELPSLLIFPNRVIACRAATRFCSMDKTEALAAIAEFCGEDAPRVSAALEENFTPDGQKVTSLDRWGSGDAGWIARRDAGIRLGLLDDPELAEDCKALLAFRDFTRRAWDTIILDKLAIVVALPIEYHYDDQDNLHSATGPAIAWEKYVSPKTGEVTEDKDWFWHGQAVPRRIIEAPRSYTREEYLAISNTEERRAIGESGGWEWLVTELLGCTSIDKWTDPKTGLAYELLGSGERRFLRKQSPKLKAGAQPSYVEPVHMQLKTAAGARKWQAARNLSPGQCDKDPELVYGFEL